MIWSAVGALALGAAVMTGAFGAHALRGRLDEYSLGVYDRAVFYHYIHGFALLVVPLFARLNLIPEAGASRVCLLFLAGLLLFSGSLYALALTGTRGLGAITPLGGLGFIGGWLLLAWEIFRARG